jgi:hypothetical protein
MVFLSPYEQLLRPLISIHICLHEPNGVTSVQVLSPTRMASLHLYFLGCTVSIMYCSLWRVGEAFIS